MKYYIYLIKSLKDNHYYIGQTNNLEKRLAQHNSGKVKSTSKRRPFKLIGYKVFYQRNEARWEEYQLKKSAWKRKKLIKELFYNRARGAAG